MDYSSYMGQSFTKLFSSITDSTIWSEPDHVRIVWITLLASADARGRVFSSVPGLAVKSRVSMPLCVEALDKLMAPDEWSRTKTHEGRRLEPIEGGWKLINYSKYRELRDEESVKASKRDWWNKNRGLDASLEKLDPTRPHSNQEEVEEEVEEEKKKIKDTSPSAPLSQLEKFSSIWNERLSPLGYGKMERATPKRKAALKERQAEDPSFLETFSKAVAYLAEDAWWRSKAKQFTIDLLFQPNRAQTLCEKTPSATLFGASNGTSSDHIPAHRRAVDENYKRQLLERIESRKAAASGVNEMDPG